MHLAGAGQVCGPQSPCYTDEVFSKHSTYHEISCPTSPTSTPICFPSAMWPGRILKGLRVLAGLRRLVKHDGKISDYELATEG